MTEYFEPFDDSDYTSWYRKRFMRIVEKQKVIDNMFALDAEQKKKLDIWKKEVQAKGVEQQKASIPKSDPFYDAFEISWENGFPYIGSIGGAFTYSFKPTSIAMIVKVTDSITGEMLDLTDYDSW
jgi:hypothetical protein